MSVAYSDTLEAFKSCLESNGKSTLTPALISSLLKSLDPGKWTDSELERLISALGGKENISYEEFVNFAFDGDSGSEDGRLQNLLDGKKVDASYLSGATGELHSGKELPTFGSLADSFEFHFESYGSRPCLGHHGGDGEYLWTSYSSFSRTTKQLAASLADRFSPGACIGISAVNSLSWFIVDYACMWAGLCVVPISEVWDREIVVGVSQRAELQAVFVDGQRARAFVQLKQRLESLSLVVAMDSMAVEPFRWQQEQHRAVIGNLQASGTTDFVADARSLAERLGVELTELDIMIRRSEPIPKIHARGPDDMHTILHTSGTTGLPKGVIYSDALWLRNMATYPGALSVGFSYMPLAFITDRHTVATTLWNGGRVGIATLTGTDNTASIFRELKDVQPTILKGVPKFWEGVHDAARNMRDLKLNILGGRTETLICGAGALSGTVAEWFRSECSATKLQEDGSSIEVPVKFLIGYGSTEAGNLATNRKILPHVDWKLLPVEGMDMTDDVGEFAVKTGAMMFGGYYKDEEKTKSSFTDDGYYKMGDIVRITRSESSEVFVDVIGRAKSSIKLGNGKWIMVESLEDFYRELSEVRYIFLHGDSSHNEIVAVVDLEPSAQRMEPAALLAHLHSHAAAAGRPLYEWVGEVALATRPFSRVDNTLNGTGKLNRRAILKQYSEVVEDMLARVEDHTGMEELPLPGSDPTKSFKEQGGSSMQAGKIAALYKELGLPVERSIELLLESQMSMAQARSQLTTEVRNIQQVEREKTGQADPNADAVLGATDDFAAVPPCAATGVLLTGVTGFVGVHTLAAMMSTSALRGQIWCHVRANSSQEARKRVESSLARYGLLELGTNTKEAFHCICGDIGKPMLGLSPEGVAELESKVGSVLHFAAVVDLAAGYEKHRRANVLGTLEACRLSAKLGARLLHISTTDVMPRRDTSEATIEAFDLALSPEKCPDGNHGYALSKWISERIVVQAKAQGLRCSILRLGMISGHSVLGTCSARDWIPRFLIGLAHTGAFPESEEKHSLPHALPVDSVAMALAALLQVNPANLDAQGITVGSFSPKLTMPHLRKLLLEFGVPFTELHTLPFPEWIQKVKDDATLSAWPILQWAETLTEFPVFNTRSMVEAEVNGGPRALQVLGVSAAADLLREGMSPSALHAMVHYLLG